jgi:CHAT domain-containing protein
VTVISSAVCARVRRERWLAAAIVAGAAMLGSLAHAADLSDPYLEGREAYRRGEFEQAIPLLRQAEAKAREAGDASRRADTLLRLGEAQQALGGYRDALASFEQARDLAGASGDGVRQAAARGGIGNVGITLGPRDAAKRELAAAAALAREQGAAGLEAAILNNLGNARAFDGELEAALSAYEESGARANDAGDELAMARAHVNAARTALPLENAPGMRRRIETLLSRLRALPDSHDKACLLVNLGRTSQRLAFSAKPGSDRDRLTARAALAEAIEVADRLGDPRAGSYAYGYLGWLYEERARYEEALALTRRAIFLAEQREAPESLYLWQWQAGRILREIGREDDAIESYRRAVKLLRGLRHEMATGYGIDRSSFRDAVGPVYFQLVDLLLQRSKRAADDRQMQQRLLLEARDTVELLKAAELRDYFHDECVDALQAKQRNLDEVAERAAVVYPIVLPDRLEILLTMPSGLMRFTVDVPGETLTAEVRELRRLLEKRTSRQYLPHAQTLHRWLVAPIVSALEGAEIDTLIFVPDGPLRTIPMAALHDGKSFLIERYGVATTPGLALTDPRPLDRSGIKLMLAGLSVSREGFPPLPSVPTELASVQALYGGVQLLDEEFQLARVESTLSDQELSIVHIASHGEFRSDVEQTFLLAYDGRLTMDRLGDYVGLFKFRDRPLELLTLSACETAEGDDRAALGLAGIAIKAGARSALGTLWRVNDRAAADLIVAFYQALQDPAVSRAAALQRAQRAALQDPRNAHPAYWAAFLLISNWL